MESDTVNLLIGTAGSTVEDAIDAAWKATWREASDPTTSAERLAAICVTLSAPPQNLNGVSERDYARVRRAIHHALAANPNTPLAQLSSLASTYPAGFCRNPAAPLVLLEDPGFVRRLWRKRPLLRCAELPFFLAEQIEKSTSNSRLREEVRLHVVVSGEVTEGDAFAAVRNYWRAYAKSARRSRREQTRLVELAALDLIPEWAADPARTAHLRAQLNIASDLNAAPLALAELLWTTDSWLVRLAAGLNPNTDSEDRAVIENDLIRRHLYGRCWKQIARACRPTKREVDNDAAAQQRILNACRVAARFPRRHALSVRVPKVEQQVGRLRSADPAAGIWGGQYITQFGADFALWRFAQLIDPKTSAYDKKIAARSLRWQERLGAACGLNPRYPRSAAALAALTGDGNRLVRAAARARLSGEVFIWDEMNQADTIKC